MLVAKRKYFNTIYLKTSLMKPLVLSYGSIFWKASQSNNFIEF